MTVPWPCVCGAECIDVVPASEADDAKAEVARLFGLLQHVRCCVGLPADERCDVCTEVMAVLAGPLYERPGNK